MSKPFDIELFLAGILTGSHTTRQRHLRQAKTIQTAIAERWQRDNPWTWQRKHLVWFLNHHLNQHTDSTRYYYLLTMPITLSSLRKTLAVLPLDEGQKTARSRQWTPYWQNDSLQLEMLEKDRVAYVAFGCDIACRLI